MRCHTHDIKIKGYTFQGTAVTHAIPPTAAEASSAVLEQNPRQMDIFPRAP